MNKLRHILIAGSILAMMSSNALIAQTKVIAHRGYWKCEGSAQNSIAALNKAHEIGVYGSEFDVLLTADNVAVVNHDDIIEGLTIEQTPYEKLKNIKLKNGETLPTLEDYLQQGKKNKGTQLILEIKPHKTKEHEDKAVAATIALVKKYKLQKQVEYISFSKNICEQLRKLDKKAEISYLGGDLSPQQLKDANLSGLDYHYSVFEKNPTWLSEAKQLGLTTNAWTVNSEEVMQRLIDQKVDYITTDHPVELQKLLKK